MQQNNHHSQCILLALCVCALGRGLPEKVLGLAQRRGGWGPPPPPTAPQTVEHPSGSHIGWRQPPWWLRHLCFVWHACVLSRVMFVLCLYNVFQLCLCHIFCCGMVCCVMPVLWHVSAFVNSAAHVPCDCHVTWVCCGCGMVLLYHESKAFDLGFGLCLLNFLVLMRLTGHMEYCAPHSSPAHTVLRKCGACLSFRNWGQPMRRCVAQRELWWGWVK